MFEIKLTFTQRLTYLKFTSTTTQNIKTFLDNIKQEQQLYIRCISHLISKCAKDREVHDYCQKIPDDYWLPILNFFQIMQQPHITNFNLLMGMQFYQDGDLEKAAQTYHSFHAIEELYKQNVKKLNLAIYNPPADTIDYPAMLEQSCLGGEEHGTPIFLLRASLCFWCAQYIENTLKDRDNADIYYQLAIQFLWVAHFTKDRCQTAISNARFYHNKRKSISKDPYEFFNLLNAIEKNKIYELVEFVKPYLSDQTMVQIAENNAKRYANAFLHNQVFESAFELTQPSAAL